MPYQQNQNKGRERAHILNESKLINTSLLIENSLHDPHCASSLARCSSLVSNFCRNLLDRLKTSFQSVHSHNSTSDIKKRLHSVLHAVQETFANSRLELLREDLYCELKKIVPIRKNNQPLQQLERHAVNDYLKTLTTLLKSITEHQKTPVHQPSSFFQRYQSIRKGITQRVMLLQDHELIRNYLTITEQRERYPDSLESFDRDIEEELDIQNKKTQFNYSDTTRSLIRFLSLKQGCLFSCHEEELKEFFFQHPEQFTTHMREQNYSELRERTKNVITTVTTISKDIETLHFYLNKEENTELITAALTQELKKLFIEYTAELGDWYEQATTAQEQQDLSKSKELNDSLVVLKKKGSLLSGFTSMLTTFDTKLKSLPQDRLRQQSRETVQCLRHYQEIIRPDKDQLLHSIIVNPQKIFSVQLSHARLWGEEDPED